MNLDIILRSLVVRDNGYEPVSVHGISSRPIITIAIDSRDCEDGSAFFALKGENTDGHHHIDKAIEAGARTILCEDLPEKLLESVTYIQVANTRRYLGPFVSEFLGNPSHDMKVVGITGTNGKTTIATLLYQLSRKLGHKTGLVSTNEMKIDSETIHRTDEAATTPGALALQKALKHMKDSGCTHVFMEVSSHGMQQFRAEGVFFVGGIFTNITQDHLDYHHTFENYLKAKRSFFDRLPSTAWALANKDDSNGEFMLQNTKAKQSYYSIAATSEFDCEIARNSIQGLTLSINSLPPVQTNLVGAYNAYNLSAVYGAMVLLGEDPKKTHKKLHHLYSPAGRFEIVELNGGIIGIVDYAHSPDGLDQLLQTLNDVAFDTRKIITVFGAGGDRDVSKRPIMGKIADKLSHFVVITNDNPRSEDPMQIIHDIESGIHPLDRDRISSIPDRREAIEYALRIAEKGDIVVVAGKGHEDYQIIGKEKFHFDDKEELLKHNNL